MKELLAIVEARARSSHRPHVLATVVKVEGSSYRRPGARMLVSAAGRVAGSVSGGCLERNVVSRSLEVLMENRPRLIRYDTNDQDDLELGSSLGCQGTIEILLQPVPAGLWPLEELVAGVMAEGKPLAWALPYRVDGCPGMVGEVFPIRAEGSVGDDFLHGEALREEAERVMASKRPGHVSWRNGESVTEILIERIAPPLSLVIFGAGHDAPPLVRLAKELGHRVTVVDRRIEFAQAEHFPEADAVLCLPVHRVPGKVPLGEGSAVVVMNHHYETDRALLGLLLSRPLSYLAMLGPRKRTDRMLTELSREGMELSSEGLAALRAPAGLDIGSDNPEEIALSILAEIQAVVAGRSAVALRSRPGPIHTLAL
ncbi:Xanthine and CO dehydrogenase maturation factor, XdhC/CoxF family [Verrucomicrobium sp. GAS474]|uniref:XdhC family protein n=1 Tax=Verrucomicrobium sp. GAS474 TaxID=1882831 RepID=UPI0008792E0E|nr:XdhC/CoxI family protein [Verrucomicrobium sp. GAS474]SDU12049.1 Xanthine and CO dehydrogenase maturation factor, XdhC/CoxF family [Verrucomicrobium sp. GAS474]